MSLGGIKIALVHDELTRRGGAEVVLEELVRIFPQADVYALYAGPKPQMRVDGRRIAVRTSFLQRWPGWWRRHPSRLLPMLSMAAEQFDLSNYDLVISSASGFAKALITRVNVPHLCYCHTPTRYLWSVTHAAGSAQRRMLRWPGQLVLHYLRLADFAAAQRVDFFIANSRFTQARIRTYYRRSSAVIHPPIKTSFYTPEPRGFQGGVPKSNGFQQGYFLAVGRLTPTKNFIQAIRVCEKLQLPLIIVGSGADLPRLKRNADKYARFVGTVDDERLRDYYRGAQALLQPGEEDFGMAAAEALACGTPVIAVGQGGVLDVVRQRETGLLYEEPHEEALAESLRQFLMNRLYFPPERLQHSVLRLAAQRFRKDVEDFVARAFVRFKTAREMPELV